MTTLEVGNTVRLRFGPFLATGEVLAVDEIGAIVLVNDDAELVGFEQAITAPNGQALTTDLRTTFIGRAHWTTTEVIA